jgi:excisionase family DNA binding protein
MQTIADKLSVTQAGEYLGVTRQKISQLIRDGKLKVVGENPLDGRVRLVRRRDLDRLKKYIVADNHEEEKETAGD